MRLFFICMDKFWSFVDHVDHAGLSQQLLQIPSCMGNLYFILYKYIIIFHQKVQFEFYQIIDVEHWMMLLRFDIKIYVTLCLICNRRNLHWPEFIEHKTTMYFHQDKFISFISLYSISINKKILLSTQIFFELFTTILYLLSKLYRIALNIFITYWREYLLNYLSNLSL